MGEHFVDGAVLHLRKALGQDHFHRFGQVLEEPPENIGIQIHGTDGSCAKDLIDLAEEKADHQMLGSILAHFGRGAQNGALGLLPEVGDKIVQLFLVKVRIWVLLRCFQLIAGRDCGFQQLLEGSDGLQVSRLGEETVDFFPLGVYQLDLHAPVDLVSHRLKLPAPQVDDLGPAFRLELRQGLGLPGVIGLQGAEVLGRKALEQIHAFRQLLLGPLQPWLRLRRPVVDGICAALTLPLFLFFRASLPAPMSGLDDELLPCQARLHQRRQQLLPILGIQHSGQPVLLRGGRVHQPVQLIHGVQVILIRCGVLLFFQGVRPQLFQFLQLGLALLPIGKKQLYLIWHNDLLSAVFSFSLYYYSGNPPKMQEKTETLGRRQTETLGRRQLTFHPPGGITENLQING